MFLSFYKRLVFKNLKKSKVVIYDEVRKELMEFILPKNTKKYLIKIRPSEYILNIGFNYIFIKNTIKNLTYFENYIGINFFSFLKIFLIFLKDMRIKTIIDITNPDLILTFNDNNPRLGRVINKYFIDKEFIAIQNGCRNTWESGPKCIHFDYFAFSSLEKNNLISSGWKIRKYHNVGSLNASINFLEASKKKVPIVRDILIVSSWRGNIKIDDDYIEQMDAMTKMNELLKKFIDKNSNLKVSILLRSEKNSIHWHIPYYDLNEENYYKSIFGKRINLINNEMIGKTCYFETLRSKLSVGFLSSVIYESSIYGLNAMYLNPLNHDSYHKDFPEKIVYRLKDYSDMQNIFEERLNKKYNYEGIIQKSKKTVRLIKSKIEKRIK